MIVNCNHLSKPILFVANVLSKSLSYTFVCLPPHGTSTFTITTTHVGDHIATTTTAIWLPSTPSDFDPVGLGLRIGNQLFLSRRSGDSILRSGSSSSLVLRHFRRHENAHRRGRPKIQATRPQKNQRYPTSMYLDIASRVPRRVFG